MAHPKFSSVLAALVVPALLYVPCMVFAAQLLTAGRASDQENAAGLAALAKARVNHARKVYEGVMQAMPQTRQSRGEVVPSGRPEDAYLWSVRWLNAQRDMSSDKEGQVTALEGHLARMKELQQLLARMSGHLLPSLWAEEAPNYYVTEAEILAGPGESQRKGTGGAETFRSRDGQTVKVVGGS